MTGARRLALLLSALLVVYGNAIAASPAAEGAGRLAANLAAAAVALAAGFAAGFRSRELALEGRRMPRSALVGLAVAAPAALLAAAAILLAPDVTGAPVEFEEAQSPSTAAFLRDTLLLFPAQTAIPEELVFRGVLYTAWLRAGGDRVAVLATATVFALWHVVPLTITVRDAGVLPHDALLPLGIAAGLAFLFAAGVVLAVLRMTTSSLAAPVLVHWLVVAAARIAVRVAG